MVVFYSGDGGWARLTTHVSGHLRDAGIPVVGIDCMHYFWKEKQPGQAAHDLAAAISHYSDAWGTAELILLGYSMGADVVPLLIRHLPETMRARISHVVLMSPAHHVCLKFRFIGWLGYESAPHHSHPILPDLEAIAPIPVSIFAGEKERESLAHDLDPTIYDLEFLPGGHHYGGDYAGLAERVLARVSSRSAQ
jgi:type IV secretory pathway VirJ component